jgi:hypothetical protein
MPKFEVDGVNYEFVQSPTFGEARAIEKVAGIKFAEMADPTKQSVDLMQALVWVSMRRENPDITFDDLDDLDMGILSGLQEEVEAQADPTEPGDAAGEPTTSALSD